MATRSDQSPSEASRKEFLDERCTRFGQESIARGQRATRLLTCSRAGVVIATLLLATGWIIERWNSAVSMALLVVAGSVFLFIRSSIARTGSDRARILAEINAQGSARISRTWNLIPDIDVGHDAAMIGTAVDLDLFGDVSLIKLICTAQTQDGIATLTSWLTESHAESDVTDRRRFARELAGAVEWRQRCELICRDIRRQSRSARFFRDWTGGKEVQENSFLMDAYSRIVFYLMPLSLIVFVAFPSGFTFAPIMLLILANFLIMVAFSGTIHTFVKELTVHPNMPGLSSLVRVFSHIALAPLSEQIPAQRYARDAERAMGRLGKILYLATISQRPALAIFLYFPLQLFLSWDLLMVRLLTNWKTRFGGQCEAWFGAIGHIEALNSIASVEFEHPGWGIPELSPWQPGTAVCVVATGMGHPLLPDAECVRNDLKIGPSGSLVLLTGSNMSGKSTLLRAVGLNVTLALAGANCCCHTFRLPLLQIATSIKLTDSIGRGTSLFLAEVLRLREIVSAINDSNIRPTLVLIDEILHGTNSRERCLAVERFIAYMLATSAIGIVTTHDLDVADKSLRRDSLRLFHFRDSISESDGVPGMVFDYLLRPGPTTHTNAIKIIDLMGLP